MKGDLRLRVLPPSLKSQAEAHYKGNRHARRVKGIEAAKTRGREPSVRESGDPAPAGSTPPSGDGVAPRPGVSESPSHFSADLFFFPSPQNSPSAPLLLPWSPFPLTPKVSPGARHSDVKIPSCHPTHPCLSSSQQSPYCLSSPLPK